MPENGNNTSMIHKKNNQRNGGFDIRAVIHEEKNGERK
jgi:hypothetical protein